MPKFLAFFSILLFCAVAFAADSLNLKIVDPQGAAVSGARVVLYAPGSQRAAATTLSDSNGVASFTLPTGDYRVEVLAPTFALYTGTVSLSRENKEIQLKAASHAEAVSVTAAQTPLESDLTGTVPFTLDANTLVAMQPTSAAEAIRFLPGAVVNTQGRRGGLASLFVRGGESRHNKFIVDGVTVNDVGGTFDFGVVPVQEYDRIEFVRGAESALYGTDAMTSTLQTFSRTGSTQVPQLELGADGGNFASGHGYASLSGAIRRLDYNVFGDQFNTQGQGLNDAYSNASHGGNLGLRITEHVSARLRIRHSNNRTGVQSFWDYPGQAPLPPEQDQYARQNNLISSLDLTANLGRWRHQFSGEEYHHTRLNRDQVEDRGCTFPIFDCAFNDLFTMSRAAFDYRGEFTPFSFLRTVFGYRFEDENGFVNQDFSGFIINSHGLRRNHELFDELILTHGRASLIVGGRYVRNESFGNKALPRVAATYQLWNGNRRLSGTRLRFAFGKAFKEPRLEESFGAVGAFGLVTLPNPDLKPEEIRSFETGVTQGFGARASLSATYFHNDFTRLIAFSTDPVTFVSQYINLGKSLAHGAELEFHARPTSRISFDTSYAYTSTQVLESNSTSPLFAPGAPLLRRPKHSGQVLLNYTVSRWGANLGGSFIGRRPDSDFFILPTPITSVAGYARVDAGGWFNVNHRATAYLNVENLLNRKYQEVLGYPALGANFRAGMRFRLGGD